MKKHYVILGLIIATSTLFAASDELLSHYNQIKLAHSKRLEELRAITGTQDCVAFLEKELTIVDSKIWLYGINLERVIGTFNKLLNPVIQDRDPYNQWAPAQQKALVHFMYGKEQGSDVVLSCDTDGIRQELQGTIRPLFIEVITDLAQALPRNQINLQLGDGSISLAFNLFALNELSRIGNTTSLFLKELTEELSAKSLLLKQDLFKPGEPTTEVKALAKDVAAATREKALLTRIVDSFENLKNTLRAAGRMS